MTRLLLVATLTVTACGSAQGVCRAPEPSICVTPLVATCLNTGASLVACETRVDVECGVDGGVSAQIWASVEAAEEIQGLH